MTREGERRWHRRQVLAINGRAVLNDESSALRCTIQDMSAGGACIRFSTAVSLPPEFMLEIPSYTLRVGARVVWSRGEYHGVQIVWPQHTLFGALGARPGLPGAP